MLFQGTTKLFEQPSLRYKLCLFPIVSKTQIVNIEYPQGICFPTFIAENFSGLFADPSTFFSQIFKVSVNNVQNFIFYCKIMTPLFSFIWDH